MAVRRPDKAVMGVRFTLGLPWACGQMDKGTGLICQRVEVRALSCPPREYSSMVEYLAPTQKMPIRFRLLSP